MTTDTGVRETRTGFGSSGGRTGGRVVSPKTTLPGFMTHYFYLLVMSCPLLFLNESYLRRALMNAKTIDEIFVVKIVPFNLRTSVKTNPYIEVK